MSPAGSPAGIRSGDLIDVWDGGEIVAAVVIGEEKGRLRIATERGDEIRIPASRVAHRAGRAAASEPVRAAHAAARHAAAAAAKAAQVDAASLWEILVDAGGRHTTEALASLALGEATPESASAIIRRLHAERIYFERKGDLWEARSRQAVDETLRRIRATEEKTRRREAFLARMRDRTVSAAGSGDAAGGRGAPGFDSEDARFIQMIIDLAVHGDEAPDRREAGALIDDLGATGPTPALAAFDLLVRAGIFVPDENLEIRRFNLRTAFPPEVESEARRLAESPRAENRRDLTALKAFTVDDVETVEIDDALSWEPGEGGGGTAGIHIADPSAFVLPGDPVDEEAQRRAATYYLADRRLPMLPACISEGAASLAPGCVRPALSFLVDVDAGGDVAGFEMTASIIRSRARLTYDEADAFLAGGGSAPDRPAHESIPGSLRALERIAGRHEAKRAEAGGITIRAPEVDVRVDADGSVRLKRIDERGPARRLVAEFMILANSLAAAFCSERGIPSIYRRQPPPERRPDPLPDGPYDPVAVRTLRRSLRRGEIGLAPDLHYALGLGAYLQVTSPLRRYQDLAVLRQIKASLAGDPLPYDAEAVARIAATTEEAERAARSAEAGSDAYWILRYLQGRIGQEIEAIIVNVDPRRTEVELHETLTTETIAPRPDHTPGARVRLAIEDVRPRQRILRLREVLPEV